MVRKTILFTFIVCIFSSLSYAQTTVQGAQGKEVTISDASRIVTIGGDITEIVYALGAGDQVVAVDQSSSYPPQVHQLPKVPYLRTLSAEGILSTQPTLVLSSVAAEPKTVIQQLRATGVPVLLVSNEASTDGTITKIEVLAEALQKQKKAEKLIQTLRSQLEKAASLRETLTEKPKVMFILSAAGGSSPMVAGEETSAATIISLAGGENAFTGFTGYKPANGEAIASAQPDIILMMNNRVEKDQYKQSILQLPGIKLTPAGKNGRIIAMDGNYLLGFGPRTGAAVLDLMEHFHPDAKIAAQ